MFLFNFFWLIYLFLNILIHLSFCSFHFLLYSREIFISNQIFLFPYHLFLLFVFRVIGRGATDEGRLLPFSLSPLHPFTSDDAAWTTSERSSESPGCDVGTGVEYNWSGLCGGGGGGDYALAAITSQGSALPWECVLVLVMNTS